MQNQYQANIKNRALFFPQVKGHQLKRKRTGFLFNFASMKKWLYIIGLIFLFAANTTAANADFLGERVEVAAKTGRQTFEIADGVRRAKAAQELGHTSIKAMDHTGKTFQVPLKDLYSPFKSSIDVSTPLNQFRYDRIYNGFKAGDALPPIYVSPGSRGVSIFDVNFIW